MRERKPVPTLDDRLLTISDTICRSIRMPDRGVTAREALCKEVMPPVSDTTGEKGGIVDVLGGVMAPLIESIRRSTCNTARRTG